MFVLIDECFLPSSCHPQIRRISILFPSSFFFSFSLCFSSLRVGDDVAAVLRLSGVLGKFYFFITVFVASYMRWF